MSVKSKIPPNLLDEEFISCDNCLILFEKHEKDHQPGYGEGCHRSFCSPCIESLTSSDTKILTNRPICKLSEKKSEKPKTTGSSNPDWCLNCNGSALIGCCEGQHAIQSVDHLYTTCSQRLKVLIDQTNYACDNTLKDLDEIQSVHKIILAWIGWLQQKITQWNSSNTATITQLESLKTPVGFHVAPHKEMSTTINQLHQHIVEFHNKLQLAKTAQFKGTGLIQSYRNAKWGTAPSSQSSSFIESPPLLVNWFSTALSHDNKSCRDVLSFLVRLLGREELVPGNIPVPDCSSNENVLINQTGQVKGNYFLKSCTENIDRKDVQRLHKRQLEEGTESSTQLSKKVRVRRPVRIYEDQRNSCIDDIVSHKISDKSSAVNLTFKEEMELQVAAANEKLTQLGRKLQDAENKLKLMEEKMGDLTEEKNNRHSDEMVNRIVRFETDLRLVAEKVKLTEDSKETTNQESSVLLQLAKKTGENYEMVLILSTAEVEQLHVVRKQLEQSWSRVAIVLQERTNHTTPEGIENPIFDKDLAEKRYNQLQEQMEEMHEAFLSSSVQLIETRQANDDLILSRDELQNEIRKAKEESQQLKSKMNAAAANHVQVLNKCRKYENRIKELELEFKKLVNESTTSPTVPAVAKIHGNMPPIAEKADNEQVEKCNESEDNHLVFSSREQRVFEWDAVQPVLHPQTSVMHRPQHHVVQQENMSSVPMHQKMGQLHVVNFHAIANSILRELNTKGTDLRYHFCTNCKSVMETRFYCDKCTDFILCIPCFKKERHHHKMEIIGFDLDVQKPPANCKDTQEALYSKIERRISSLLHAIQCLDANCREPYCKSMKLLALHIRLCKFKILKSITGSSLDCCPTCGELVALIVYHAKLCTLPICKVPHCSNAKKKIMIYRNQPLVIERAQRENEEPRPAVIPNYVNRNLTADGSQNIFNSNQQLDPSKGAVEVPVSAFQPVARVAPYVAGSSGDTKSVYSTVTDAKKLKIVRENISLIIHAHGCHRGWNQCPIPHCRPMKNVLHHVRTCTNTRDTCVAHCRSSRITISHLKNCYRYDCQYCLALTASDRYNAITGPNPIVIASQLPTSNICSATEKLGNLQ